MKKRIFILFALMTSFGIHAYSHRLNEYLLASVISISKDHILLRMHLTAGEQVAGQVLKGIDKNKDGNISTAEQQAYASRVRHDLKLMIDRKAVYLRLHTLTFPETGDIRNGMGDISMSFEADLPEGNTAHQLTFENHHQKLLGVYLVNCLLPNDTGIVIGAQHRNSNQSFYQLNFTIRK